MFYQPNQVSAAMIAQTKPEEDDEVNDLKSSILECEEEIADMERYRGDPVVASQIERVIQLKARLELSLANIRRREVEQNHAIKQLRQLQKRGMDISPQYFKQMVEDPELCHQLARDELLHVVRRPGVDISFTFDHIVSQPADPELIIPYESVFSPALDVIIPAGYPKRPFEAPEWIRDLYESEFECDPPYSSENHITTLCRGEILCGGGRRGRKHVVPEHRRKPRKREPMFSKHTFLVSPNNIVPEEVMVRLKWPSSFVLTSVGAQNVSKRWCPNAAYDLDPILASTAMPGFAEWAAFYSFYRVVAYSYVLEVVNAQPFPLTAYVINSNNDPGTGGTNFEAYSTANFGVRAVLPPVGTAGAKHVFKKRIRIAKIIGSEAAETDDNYRGLVTGIPADLIWLAIGLRTNSATNLLTAAGVYCQLALQCEIKFYGRIDLTN